MSKLFCVVLYLAFTFLSVYCSDTNKCVQQSPCLCNLNEYSKLDISSILDNKKPPQLVDIEGSVTYYFLGCKGGTVDIDNKTYQGSLIKHNSTLDKANKTSTLEFAPKDIKFELVPKSEVDYQLVFNTSTNENAITIRLICDDFQEPFLKILHSESNELILSSPSVCMITEHHGLSRGSVFLILLLVTAMLYFFGGALVLYFIRGARGIEMVPNIDFWRNLPGLVKDGVIFLLSGCKPTLVSTAESYDRI